MSAELQIWKCRDGRLLPLLRGESPHKSLGCRREPLATLPLVAREPASEKAVPLPLEPMSRDDFQEWFDRVQKQYFVFGPVELVANPATEKNFPSE